MTRLEKKYMKFMTPIGIVKMNIKNDTPQGFKSRFLAPLVSSTKWAFVDILCAQTLSNSDIHGNQHVLQRNGPVLTPTILALMPGKSQKLFCKAGANLARINAYFFLQCVFCVICILLPILCPLCSLLHFIPGCYASLSCYMFVVPVRFFLYVLWSHSYP